MKVPVNDSVGRVNENVGTEKEPVGEPVGMLWDSWVKMPVKEDSWRLAAALENGGGGGAECEPVGWVKVLVNDLGGAECNPVGAECDS